MPTKQEQIEFEVPHATGDVLCSTQRFPLSAPVGTLVCRYSLLRLELDFPNEWRELCQSHSIVPKMLSGFAWTSRAGERLMRDISTLAFGATSLKEFSRIEYHGGLQHSLTIMSLRIPAARGRR